MEAKTMILVERLKSHSRSADKAGLYKLHIRLFDDIDEAISLLEAAERALEPFAKRAKDIDPIVMDGEAVLAPALAGDLRLARTVRDKIKGGA